MYDECRKHTAGTGSRCSVFPHWLESQRNFSYVSLLVGVRRVGARSRKVWREGQTAGQIVILRRVEVTHLPSVFGKVFAAVCDTTGGAKVTPSLTEGHP